MDCKRRRTGAYTNPGPDSNSNSYSDAGSYAHSHSDCNAHGYCNSYAVTDRYPHRNTTTYSDAQISPHTRASLIYAFSRITLRCQ